MWELGRYQLLSSLMEANNSTTTKAITPRFYRQCSLVDRFSANHALHWWCGKRSIPIPYALQPVSHHAGCIMYSCIHSIIMVNVPIVTWGPTIANDFSSSAHKLSKDVPWRGTGALLIMSHVPVHNFSVFDAGELPSLSHEGLDIVHSSDNRNPPWVWVDVGHQV